MQYRENFFLLIFRQLQNDENFFSKNLDFFRRLYEKSVSLPRLLTSNGVAAVTVK